MTAQTLRDAAKVLRERANAAPQGVWLAEDGQVWLAHDEWGSSLSGIFHKEPDWATGASAYVATMHPGVGLAVADLLDTTAHALEEWGPADITEQWFTLARAILGSDA